MSVIDTIVDAVAPQENERAHREARAKAKAAASPGDWLSLILVHHEAIETAFASVKSAMSADARTASQKHLALVLTGHANAEESTLYPAMRRVGGKEGATTAYSEQATAKAEMADLELLAPMSQQYLDKLEHIRDSVAHHIYQEENTWFLDLKANTTAQEQALLAERYQEQFDRYIGREIVEPPDDGAATVRPGNAMATAHLSVPRD